MAKGGANTRWARLMSAVMILGFSIQPSEFLKPALIVLVAFLLSEGGRRPEVPGSLFAILLFVMSAALLVAQPDFGQTMLLMLVFAALFFLNGLPWVAIVPIGALGAGGILAAYMTLPHVQSRVDRFLGELADGGDRGDGEGRCGGVDGNASGDAGGPAGGRSQADTREKRCPCGPDRGIVTGQAIFGGEHVGPVEQYLGRHAGRQGKRRHQHARQPQPSHTHPAQLAPPAKASPISRNQSFTQNRRAQHVVPGRGARTREGAGWEASSAVSEANCAALSAMPIDRQASQKAVLPHPTRSLCLK